MAISAASRKNSATIWKPPSANPEPLSALRRRAIASPRSDPTNTDQTGTDPERQPGLGERYISKVQSGFRPVHVMDARHEPIAPLAQQTAGRTSFHPTATQGTIAQMLAHKANELTRERRVRRSRLADNPRINNGLALPAPGRLPPCARHKTSQAPGPTRRLGQRDLPVPSG